MCYRCEVCTSVTKVRQPLLRIIQTRDVKIPAHNEAGFIIRQEIAKEIPACPLCYEGWKNGIPLSQLAKMHRPTPLVSQNLGGGHVIGYAEFPFPKLEGKTIIIKDGDPLLSDPSKLAELRALYDGKARSEYSKEYVLSPEARTSLREFLDRHGYSSPKEERTNQFLEAAEASRKPRPKGSGKKPKVPLKPLIKRGNANRQAKQKAKEAESGG